MEVETVVGEVAAGHFTRLLIEMARFGAKFILSGVFVDGCSAINALDVSLQARREYRGRRECRRSELE